MKIILSPAKKMKVDTDSLEPLGLPQFVEQADGLLSWLRGQSGEELQGLWKCNDSIARENFDRISHMDLRRNLTPAVLAYEGIAYQYMAPAVFEREQYEYVQEHLRILSAFYGVLRPMDGVVPYRLEMQAKAAVGGHKNLYEFWGDKLYREIDDGDRIILNLASKEYFKCIEKYLEPEDTCVTCIFGERKGDKVIQKGTQAKMARGEMVRFMAEREIVKVEEIRGFDRLGYRFEEELSSGKEYVFLK